MLSARTFNFSRDWFAVGWVLENSLELRKETHYALALGRWLELEADRSPTLEALWTDFTFVAGKLGFVQVELKLKAGARTWQLPGQLDSARKLHCVHELGSADLVALEFCGDSGKMSPQLFQHLSELAAEYWLKAATRWQAVNKLPLEFTGAGQE